MGGLIKNRQAPPTASNRRVRKRVQTSANERTCIAVLCSILHHNLAEATLSPMADLDTMKQDELGMT